ncbi:hypothetical protein BO70DRAFT_83982 [Aspergillus heteromorphus CBS 117.55]|uniref:Uncharacterized protein n=1 Tax=Aspergillus heteromorphus CBS 117.55 TaxID=1448321 RepID=A0A317WYN1_9EURO|nr:uncharacterized protein BO70DRAFT_83982 [Aspergillus heteromorphus CBS 117.55]PWY91061.1 hypothetical protein BO70DRAFT_83982 [Aspergillus heteromorphus CBS 117.55]
MCQFPTRICIPRPAATHLGFRRRPQMSVYTTLFYIFHLFGLYLLCLLLLTRCILIPPCPMSYVLCLFFVSGWGGVSVYSLLTGSLSYRLDLTRLDS